MNKQTMLKLLVCAFLCAATPFGLRAQNAPAAPDAAAPGGGARRGGGPGMFGFGPLTPPGPPAPVPPEVAIVRPTQAEVDQMNTDLKKFIDSSADRELLKKYEALLTVQIPRANSAIAPAQTQVRTTQRHNRFVETAKTNDIDVLFEGDSITDWWQQSAAQGGGADVQKKYFGDVNTANFAVAGDTTQGVLWGLQNGEGQGHKPKAVMLMIGTNNKTQGNTAQEIAEGVGADVYELRKDFPDAKILLLAIFPRGAGTNDPNRVGNEEANKIIARLHDGQHVFFKNINDKFLDAEGRLIGFRNDNLHPNAQGYEIWAAAVADTLKNWLN
jgi:lysophospholipase L1-like esterase